MSGPCLEPSVIITSACRPWLRASDSSSGKGGGGGDESWKDVGEAAVGSGNFCVPHCCVFRRNTKINTAGLVDRHVLSCDYLVGYSWGVGTAISGSELGQSILKMLLLAVLGYG